MEKKQEQAKKEQLLNKLVDKAMEDISAGLLEGKCGEGKCG